MKGKCRGFEVLVSLVLFFWIFTRFGVFGIYGGRGLFGFVVVM